MAVGFAFANVCYNVGNMQRWEKLASLLSLFFSLLLINIKHACIEKAEN